MGVPSRAPVQVSESAILVNLLPPPQRRVQGHEGTTEQYSAMGSRDGEYFTLFSVSL